MITSPIVPPEDLLLIGGKCFIFSRYRLMAQRIRPKLTHKMRVLLGILLSLMIHFFFAWSVQYAPLLTHKLKENIITIDLIEEELSQDETKKTKQIVRDTEAPDESKAEESEDPLAFLSGRDQRVKKQTQAAQSGLTRNRSNVPLPDQTPQEPAPETKTEQTSKPQFDPNRKGNLEAFTPKYRKTPTLRQPAELDQGMSTIGESLPQNVAVGSFTALNTDRYLYYSFFSRIEELIRFRWETSVQNSIDRTPPENLLHNPSGVWTTHMEIWLKPNGELHSTHIMKEAGYRGFDQAAIQAFVQARLFPNPPEEMIESDGLIHLKYSFQVRYEPKVLVRSSD